MVYVIAWNEAAPVGSSVNAATIDTELQNLKKSVRERMNDILSNAWETDGDNPKLLDLPFSTQPSERAVVKLNSNESITTATATAIPWDTEDVDVGDLVDLGAQATRITIVNTGFYLVVGSLLWASGTTGVRQAYLRINGSTTIANQGGHAGDAPSPGTIVTYLGALTAADYVECLAYHGQGTNLNVLTSTVTHFSINRFA